jgi:hypothetical protein
MGLTEAASPDQGSFRPSEPGRRRRRLTIVAFAVALVSFAVAVGGLVFLMASDRGPKAVAEPPDPLIGALKHYVTTTSLGAVDDKDATCMARSIVDTIGRARLVQVGVQNGADLLTALNRQEVQTGLPKAMECLDNADVETMIIKTLKPSVLGRLNVTGPECLVKGWMKGWGRTTLVRIYALWASGAGAELTRSLNPDQLGVLSQVLAQCGKPGTAPAAPPAP